MPEYLAPGVYVEEIRTGPRPIEGVSTSTAGFAGETERGRTTPYAVRGFFDNGGQRLFVARVIGEASVTAAISLDGDPGATTLRATGKGDWGNNILIAVRPASVAPPAAANPHVPPWFRIQIVYYADGIPDPFVDPTDPNELANPDRRTPDAFEDFDNLSADPTLPNFAKTVVNGASQLVEITDCPGPPALVNFPDTQLAGGTHVPAGRDDYLGAATVDPEQRNGLAGLAAIREISLMAIPDEVVIEQLASGLQDTCDAVKDRFAVLSEHRPQVDVALIRPLRDTSYGATYYIVAGDLTGGLRPLSHTLTRAEHDILNPRGVNVIRDFRREGRDIRVWGARTMSSDPMWKYISVRRLCIFIEQSIVRGTRWAVFEPNSEPTWVAVRTSIEIFLRTVWRNGALMGRTEDEAFFVKCDRTTMTQDDIDEGRLICLIGVAPLRPAEFVIFRISQKTTAWEECLDDAVNRLSGR